MRTRQSLKMVALLALTLGGAPVHAHQWSAAECREVSEFLRNAALSRDYGASAEQFLGRMREDIELVRAFPPQLRWVVADAEDEALLLDAAAQVFYLPREPVQHEREFLDGCLQRFAIN